MIDLQDAAAAARAEEIYADTRGSHSAAKPSLRKRLTEVTLTLTLTLALAPTPTLALTPSLALALTPTLALALTPNRHSTDWPLQSHRPLTSRGVTVRARRSSPSSPGPRPTSPPTGPSATAIARRTGCSTLRR